MGSGGRSVDDTHHVVNVDGNLMVLKTYAPLTSASSADELGEMFLDMWEEGWVDPQTR